MSVCADSLAIGKSVFDFDASSDPLTPEQQSFFEKYKEAVNSKSEPALLALQDPSFKACANQSTALIVRDFKDPIPDDSKVKFFKAPQSLKADLDMGDMASLAGEPTAVFGISGHVNTKDAIKIVTILRPVREVGTSITIVPYCLTEKGEAMLRPKPNNAP